VNSDAAHKSSTASKIFISYAHEDAAVADLVVAALAAINLAPWIDRTQINPGDSFIEKMNQGLTKASYLLLLLSRASVASRWVSREWMAALATAETVILPLLVEDCEIPPLLRDIVYIDLRQKETGLARLRSFFEKERAATAATSEISRSGVQGLDLRAVSRRTLRLLALRCMTEANLQAFLFDADLEPGMLQGTSLHERITSLLLRVANDGVLERFADWLALEPTCVRCVSTQLTKIRNEDAWSAG
jgi:hypothetical protein